MDSLCPKVSNQTHTHTHTQAWNSAMDSVVLTEFIDNKAAAALYRRLGYVLDKVGRLQ